MSFEVQPMRAGDLDQVLALQARSYPDTLHEDAAFYKSCLASSPQSVWVARKDITVLGYLVSYPWNGQVLPTLNAEGGKDQSQGKFWFLHDCAVSPDARGLGVGKALIQHGLAYAKLAGFQAACLVSLSEAINYWQRLGYMPDSEANTRWRADLVPYGHCAAYMTLSLAT